MLNVPVPICYQKGDNLGPMQQGFLQFLTDLLISKARLICRICSLFSAVYRSLAMIRSFIGDGFRLKCSKTSDRPFRSSVHQFFKPDVFKPHCTEGVDLHNLWMKSAANLIDPLRM